MGIAEKYRATSVSELIISHRLLEEISGWIRLWREGTPTKRALILYGPPGTGKTTLAHVIAGESGVPVIEMNASDTRNSESMKRIAKMASLYGDLTVADDNAIGFNKIILIDEADNIFESRSKSGGGDTGGVTELARIVPGTMSPIILTMNDFYGFRRKGPARDIINNSLAIEYRQFRRKNDLDYKSFRQRLSERLMFIADREGMIYRPEIIDLLISRNRDDIRAILNDAIAMMPYRDDAGATAEAGSRDVVRSIYDVISSTFKGRSYEQVLTQLMDKDFATEDYLMWLDKNLPSEATELSDLASAYDLLSLADDFVGRVIKKQHYAYKGYAEEIAAGLSTAIGKFNEKYVKYEFPSYIMKMSRLRDVRESRKTALARVSRLTHSGFRRTADNLWFFKEFSKNDENLDIIVDQLNLSEKEVSILKKA